MAQKDKAQVLAGVLFVVFGIGLLRVRHASYFGAGYMEGNATIPLALICIVYGLVCLVTYFRKSSK